jgi:cytochrome c6
VIGGMVIGMITGTLRLAVALLVAALLMLALFWPPPAWGLEAMAAGGGEGARLFELHCVGCHVNGGNVVRRGRTLRQATLRRNGIEDAEAVAVIAARGIGRMDGYLDVLGEDGAAAVGRWVWRQAELGWPRS